MSKTLAVASGGMDSSTLCYYLKDRGDLAGVVSVDYGQRHRRELESAKKIAQNLGVHWTLIDLTALGSLLTGSALTDDLDVPHGHYAADNMKVTVVPNRNMILLAAAGGVAVAQGASKLATAVHAGDHFVYPDCRPEFIQAVSETLMVATAGFGDVEVEAPFVLNTKAEIAATGEALMVPWEQTWTCYEGGAVHCGRCATCVERIEAFHLAGVNDPTEYADTEYWKTVV
jgi:7-cyano-7-deazaguanine synthase